jgi:hypothetical protein
MKLFTVLLMTVLACVWTGIAGLKYGEHDYDSAKLAAVVAALSLISLFAHLMVLRKK